MCSGGFNSALRSTNGHGDGHGDGAKKNTISIIYKWFEGESMKRLLSVFAIVGCAWVGMPELALAQTTGGFTLFGGPQRGYELDYYLARGKADVPDRYELNIPANKLNAPVTQIAIDYPNHYRGEFNTNRIHVVVGNEGKTLQCQEKSATTEVNPAENQSAAPCLVSWEPQSRSIQIQFTEPVAPRSNVKLVFDRVKNPVFGGMFNFNCRVSTLTGPQLPQYIGTWVLAID
jgi:hypothetical protein